MANEDNPKKGDAFEKAVEQFLAKQGMRVRRSFVVDVGVGELKRPYKFDFGSDSPKVVVECKSHSWRKGRNVPSAKMAIWNEAMYYFCLVPAEYRKMFFVRLSRFPGASDTLTSYYIRRFSHLIPHGVEIWEFDVDSMTAQEVHGAKPKAKGVDDVVFDVRHSTSAARDLEATPTNTAEIIDQIDKLPDEGQREIFAFLTRKILAQRGADPKRWLGKKLTFEEACDVVFRENRELLSLLAK